MLERYGTVNKAARICGIPPSTLRSAIDRGEIIPKPLACGTEVVLLSRVRRWKMAERRRGPKKSRTV